MKGKVVSSENCSGCGVGNVLVAGPEGGMDGLATTWERKKELEELLRVLTGCGVGWRWKHGAVGWWDSQRFGLSCAACLTSGEKGFAFCLSKLWIGELFGV